LSAEKINPLNPLSIGATHPGNYQQPGAPDPSLQCQECGALLAKGHAYGCSNEHKNYFGQTRAEEEEANRLWWESLSPELRAEIEAERAEEARFDALSPEEQAAEYAAYETKKENEAA